MTSPTSGLSPPIPPRHAGDLARPRIPEVHDLRLDRLLARHARVRLTIPDIVRSGLVPDPETFRRTIMGRRRDPGLAEVTFNRPFFAAYVERPANLAEPYDAAIGYHQRDILFLADTLKAQGFFTDAEFLYGRLLADPQAGSAAGRGLGDLLLVQSGWAAEFRSYTCDGRALDTLSRSSRNHDPSGWRDRMPGEAIDVLRQALKAEPGHPDTIFLLMTGLLRVGQWKEARRLARIYLSFKGTVPDAGVLRIRMEFPLRPEEALKQGTRMFRTWRDEEDRRWQVEINEIRSAEEIADGLPCYRRVDPPLLQPLCSLVIQDGNVVPFDQPIPYDHSYVAQFGEATVLPHFGMIQVEGRYLIAESLHHRPIHFGLFTPAVRAIADGRALLVHPETDRNEARDAIFIGTNGNYYHWLIDVLPRLRLMELDDELKDRRILVDQAIRPWQIDLLARFGIEGGRLLKADFSRPQTFRNLWVPSHLSTLMVAHPAAVNYIRNRLLGDAAHAAPKRGKRLYVSRSGVSGRAMIGAAAVEECFRRHGFTSVDPGRMTIDEQIAAFRDAEVIAGPGGAGLANAVFAPPGATILSLSSADILCQTFASIAAAIGQRSLFCAARMSLARTYPYWMWTNFDYLLDPADVALCLERLG